MKQTREFNNPNFKEVRGFKLILGYLGVIMILMGIADLLPLAFLIFYPYEAAEFYAFLIPGLSSLIIGNLLFFLFSYHKVHHRLEIHQDSFIVFLSWVYAILITALPFVISGRLNFAQAIFEVTSGWTTTGLTVVVVEDTSHMFLFFRSLTCFLGGIGLVLIMISAMSDRYGMKLYTTEGHSDRMLPNLLKSSRTILIIYCSYTLAGVLAYWAIGMNLFDALNFAMTAISTAGFGTHSASIGYYANLGEVRYLLIQIVSIILMILGAINFIAHVFLVKGKFRNFFNFGENKVYLGVISFFSICSIFAILAGFSVSVPDAIQMGIFQTVSAATCTGFQTMDLANIPAGSGQALIILLIIPMLIGGETNSTAGGFKIFRLNILFHSVKQKIKRSYSNIEIADHECMNDIDEKVYVTQPMIADALQFIILFIGVWITGIIIFTAAGYPAAATAFELASAVGTVGLSAGIITPTTPDYLLYVASAMMLLGRLEIFVIIYGASYMIETPIKALKNRLGGHVNV